MVTRTHILLVALSVCVLALAATGCSKKMIPMPSPVDRKPSPGELPVINETARNAGAQEQGRKPGQEKSGEPISPRALASLEITRQGQLLLQRGNPDNAISLFERAVSLNPGNGQNYYYLAEAWLLKGNIAQATEFNRLAGIYLGKDRDWMIRVQQQKKRIDEHR